MTPYVAQALTQSKASRGSTCTAPSIGSGEEQVTFATFHFLTKRPLCNEVKDFYRYWPAHIGAKQGFSLRALQNLPTSLRFYYDFKGFPASTSDCARLFRLVLVKE